MSRHDRLHDGQRVTTLEEQRDVTGGRCMHGEATFHGHSMPLPLACKAMAAPPSSPADVSHALSIHGYLPDDGLATSVFLALALQRPLLLGGEAGVGKTEVAKVICRWTGGELIRLQCYEGIDVVPGRVRLGLLPPTAAPARRRGQRRGAWASAPARSRSSCTTNGSC